MSNPHTTIRFEAFNNYPVRVILAANIEATGKRLGVDLKTALAAVVTQPDVKGCWLVIGPKGRSPDTITHEAYHAVMKLSAWTDAALDEEATAYHLGYLVGRLHKFLEKRCN